MTALITTPTENQDIRVGYLTREEEFCACIKHGAEMAAKRIGLDGLITTAPFNYHCPGSFDLVLILGEPEPGQVNKACVYLNPQDLSTLDEAQRVAAVANGIATAFFALSIQALTVSQN